MNEKEERLIQERKEKIENTFSDRGQLFHYLSDTLDNFFYRYLETSLTKDLRTKELLPHVYGALSFETMLEALKSPPKEAKAGIIAKAKEDRNATVRLGLWVEVKELESDRGQLRIVSEISWDHPDYQNPEKRIQKIVDFRYEELAVFRKELALKLEEACRLFD